MLGQLAEADEEEVELRLLSDAGYAEEFDALENELIDQYVRNDLSAEDRSRCEQHFLKAPERRDKLAFATSLREAAVARASDERRPVPVRHPAAVTRIPRARRLFAPAYLKAAAVAAIAVGIGWAVWALLPGRDDDGRELADLREAYKNERLIEARATGLPYARLAEKRGPGGADINEDARRRAELRALDELKQHPGPRSQHAAGRFYLADGQLDKAVGHLEAALKQQPSDAQIQSDMGAALLEQGRRELEAHEPGEASASLARALEHINAALQANPDLLEARYNKALALQHMQVPEKAREAWQDYLSRDGESRWAEEARRKLRSLAAQNNSPPSPSQLLESFLAAYRARDDDGAWEVMSRNREPATGKMVAPQLERGYISSRLNGQVESAQESLRAFVYAGELDRQRGGDPYTSDLARYYGSASAAQLRLSAQAVANIDEGCRLFINDDYEEALPRFERARGLFADAGNAQGAGLADYWISCCYTRLDRIGESIALLKEVTQFCRGRSYKWPLAQAYKWLGTNHAIRSEHSVAIKYDEQALELAESISDVYQMQKAASELGTLYAYLRQPRLSLANHYRSLSLAAQPGGASTRQPWRNFLYTATALFDFKYYEAAAVFVDEAILLGAREPGSASLSYLLHLKLGEIYSKLKRFDEALEQAELGLQIARSTPNRTAGALYVAASNLKLADIWREAGDCGRAGRHYDQALRLYEDREFDFYRYAAHKGRLLCSVTLQDEEAVRRDLSTLLGLSDRKRAQIREQRYRDSFFDTEDDVYDIAIGYEHRNRNDVKALDYAESARARSLLDALNSGALVQAGPAGSDVVSPQVSRPLTLDGLRPDMSAEMQVVMYAVLPDKLLSWVISHDGVVAVHEEPVKAADLEAGVMSYLELLGRGDDDSLKASLEASAGLYNTLFAPIAGHLNPKKRLCIIPDKALYRLPFVALFSPQSGRYLVEDWAVFYAPSLNVLRLCSEIARGKARANRELLLSVGNPAFNRRAYPDLLPLKSAEREAREVAGLFKDPIRLFGPDASKEKVLRAMQSADVIHFAGHYVIDDSTPLRSKMLLAARDTHDPVEQDSVLDASEILRHKFERARLVVLSSCQTGLDKYYRGEGAVGLSRSFIEAKIPLVVASQWPVDSDGTADLMVSFYRHRQSGLPTVEALRRAQVEMLRGPDREYRSPHYWAAFACVGGHTEY